MITPVMDTELSRNNDEFYNTIKYKEKTIKELARFINNRVDDKEADPLYCMLLGAGASVSSKIRTGQNLVEIWREQVFANLYPGEKYEIEKSKTIFKMDHSFIHGGWYNEDNEYSSLFGKIFDLPSQRRNFIEKEVSGAKPSIGYLYLSRLVQYKYLNTFFTTNFDDLLEQSLNTCNEIKRPIVCAHDSSIRNISITSKRPKVIKLHGDFLFDELKASNEETQILDPNANEKFEEFLKNYGLIVIGFGGNDDSIMMPLKELIVKQDYLKNGLYWCLRRKDFEDKNINSRLKDLLLQKKVYYILIENFDEFFATLCHETLKEKEKKNIPFNIDPKQKNAAEIQYLKEQKDLFKCSELIKSDIDERLRSFDSDSSRPTESDNILTEPDKVEMISEKTIHKTITSPEEKDIKELINLQRYEDAINMIDNILINENNLQSDLYNKFMEFKADCYNELEKIDEAIEVLDKIIIYNNKHKKNNNVNILIKKSFIIKDIKKKISILNEAYNLDKYNSFALNLLANAQEHLVKVDNNYYQTIIDNYDKSIILKPTYQNDSYLEKLNFVIQNTNSKNDIINTCDQIIQDLENKDYFSLIVYNAKIEKYDLWLKENKISFQDITNLFLDYFNNNPIYERNIVYLIQYLEICSKLNKLDEIKTILNNFGNNFSDNAFYITKKAKCILSNFRDLDIAINLLENIDKKILNAEKKHRISYLLFYIECLYYNKEYQKAYNLIQEQYDSKNFASIDIFIEILYKLDKDKYIDAIINKFDNSYHNTKDYTNYTYHLLKLDEYQDIYDTYQDLLKNNNYLVNTNDKILRINYSLAKKKLNRKITESNLEDILNQDEDKPEKAAAYILLDEIEKAEKILKKIIDDNYLYYFCLQKMPVFEDIDFNKFFLEKIPL